MVLDIVDLNFIAKFQELYYCLDWLEFNSDLLTILFKILSLKNDGLHVESWISILRFSSLLLSDLQMG